VIINLASFYSLLSRHIHIEDHYVYPLIEEVFTDEEKAALLEEFRKAEERTGSDDFFEENRKLVGELGTLIGA
jgi:hemerythrin-like domain-containing protein